MVDKYIKIPLINIKKHEGTVKTSASSAQNRTSIVIKLIIKQPRV